MKQVPLYDKAGNLREISDVWEEMDYGGSCLLGKQAKNECPDFDEFYKAVSFIFWWIGLLIIAVAVYLAYTGGYV